MWTNILTSFITIICLVGTVLNVKKIIWCFYLWALGNLLWLAFDLYSGLYSRAVLDVVQFGFAVWGIIEWSKTK